MSTEKVPLPEPEVGEEGETLLATTEGDYKPGANGEAKLPAGDKPEFGSTEYSACASTSSESTEDEGGKLKKRETWTNKIDFLLACVGFSVGLGNVWRFPYLCYKNGGGAFLLPYFICVILGGIPMFYLEVALGQFMSEGGINAWRICPLFQGIGYGTTVIVFLLNTYYNVILAWAFYYLFSSFTSLLPWSHCGNEWNTERCGVTRLGQSAHLDTNASMAGNSTNVTLTFATTNVTYTQVTNASDLHSLVDPVTEFWERKVLQLSGGVEHPGTIKWDLALCLLLAWIVVYFCIWKGVKSSGKVMYFTATSPYILMTILLIRGVTLDGAMDGIKFYLLPDFSKLSDVQVWVDAGTQIFFSYSISLGALTALGSYNKFHHNSWRDCLIFACTNSGTSLFAGFVTFSVLGFMAKQHGVSVADVAESGPGLAFIAYPKAVASMPLAPAWSILFFFMVLLLGLDSQFVGVEGFATAVTDIWPKFFRRGYNRELFIAGVCMLSYFIGLSMVTNGGVYVFQLFDYYAGSRIILLIAFFECVAVAWIYGANRFYDNLEMMLGYRISPWMKISWMGITPVFTLVMFVMCTISYSELTYNRVYVYPKWAIAIGWSMACVSVTMIPVIATIKICNEEGTFKERIQKLCRPRLLPHQLRAEDSSDDLRSEFSVDVENQPLGGDEDLPSNLHANTESAI